MLAVFPTALLGDGLQHLGDCSPALFGCLLQVAGGQLLLGLGQEPLAGLLIRLGGHGQSPGLLSGYQVRRAGGKERSSAGSWVAFCASGLETGLQRLWCSITRLLAGWGFGRNGWQREVRTTVVCYGMSQLHFDPAKAGSRCLCSCSYAQLAMCT